MPLADYPQHYFSGRAAWRAWLTRHHSQPQGIWLVYDKKVGREPQRLSYADIVEEALCFGWIDSLPRKRSDTQSMLLLTPRKPKSVWSKLNKTRIDKLLAEGLMTAAGQARIDAAKANGSWFALDEVEALIIPNDLADALAATPGARARWDALPPSARKAALQQISSAKTTETRARRVAAAAAMG
mgnify:FL=1